MLNLADLVSKVEDEELLGDDSVNKFEADTNLTSFGELADPKDDVKLQNIEKAASSTGGKNAATEAREPTINSNNMPDEIKSPEHTSSSSNDSNNSSSSHKLKVIKPEKSQLQSQTHQYAGFQADYHDFQNYTQYSSPGDGTTSIGPTPYGSKNNNKDDDPWWQCIFPWISTENGKTGGESRSGTKDFIPDEEGGPSTKIDKRNDDEMSLTSAGSDNALGERLSQRDRQAVLARLRLAQPDTINDDGAGDDDAVAETTSSKKKGILKRSSRARDNRSLLTLSNTSKTGKSNSDQQIQRRSLFPAYEPKIVEKKNLSTSFSSMARVVTIKSSKEMKDAEKSNVWWQKADYDEFRKTGRMVSKVMLQGGSEIWLATNQSWQLPNQGKAATLRRAMANVDNMDTSDKWWHKFGHSRRGLEHIASIEEGRQRQSNVKTSIRAILTEQRRQKTFHREDPEKLRMCSIQNTSWAKDLALASGASDADAVTKNFDDENRKSREFYLLKFSHAGNLASAKSFKTGTKQVVPAFMKPMVSMQLRPNLLDANTTSRLKFKKKEHGRPPNNQRRVNSDMPATQVSEVKDSGSKNTARVPIHDPAIRKTGRDSLARKAAGFANGEEAVNMSAVLTGMGPIAKGSNAARSRPVLA